MIKKRFIVIWFTHFLQPQNFCPFSRGMGTSYVYNALYVNYISKKFSFIFFQTIKWILAYYIQYNYILDFKCEIPVLKGIRGAVTFV